MLASSRRVLLCEHFLHFEAREGPVTCQAACYPSFLPSATGLFGLSLKTISLNITRCFFHIIFFLQENLWNFWRINASSQAIDAFDFKIQFLFALTCNFLCFRNCGWSGKLRSWALPWRPTCWPWCLNERRMKMLPGVGVFGTGSTARVLVPLLRAEGFSIEALWGKTEEEAKQLAEEMNISFYTSRTDDVLLHQDVDLVCINIPPPLTRQIAVKALGTFSFLELDQKFITNWQIEIWSSARFWL